MRVVGRQRGLWGAFLSMTLPLCWVFLPGTAASETVEWRRTPISVVLSVGEERVLTFPGAVQVGVPQSLSGSALRSQSTGGTVLWLARAPFESERIQVRVIETGEVLLFDVTALAEPASVPREAIEVLVPDNAGSVRLVGDRQGAITPVSLTRFAAQQFYAPERILDDRPGIRRVPMRVPEVVSLYRDARIETRMLASWQAGRYFVTAVALANKGQDRLWLDPRLLRGRFLTAAFQHNVLGPHGSRNPITTAYLVTDEPIASAIQLLLAETLEAPNPKEAK